MNPITIQCTRCDAYLVLPGELLARVQGKAGRVPCHGCGEKIRLEARHGTLTLLGARQVRDLEVEFDDAPSVRGAQLSLLPPALQDEPAEEIDAVESVRLPAAARLPSLPPPLRPSQRPSAHAELRPPRPVAGARRSAPPPSPSNPFDVLGSLAPVVPLQGVRLTEDGRLINRADETKPKARSRMRTWAPLVAAAIFATGLASARVGSMLPLQRAAAPKVKQVAALVLQSDPVVTALPAAPPSLVEEPRFLVEDEGDVDPTAKAEVDSRIEPAAVLPAAAEAASASADSEVSATAEEGEPLAADGVASEPALVTEPALTEVGEVEAPELPEFSKAAATVALQHAAAEANSCRQPADPPGSARVIVTFAPSGRATSANVSGAPYAGTATGGCIATRFRSASVPAFAGEHVTVTKTISLD